MNRLEQTGAIYSVNGKDFKSRKKTNNKWYETQDSISYWDDFSKHKIIYPNMTKYLPFFYDTHEFLTNQKCFIITGKHIAYLTAFLNSSLFKYCFKDNFPELLGGTRELSKIFFDEIPVHKIKNEMNTKFEELVFSIQNKRNNNINTRKEEEQIDQLLFDLYGLTDIERNEIGFIEIT